MSLTLLTFHVVAKILTVKNSITLLTVVGDLPVDHHDNVGDTVEHICSFDYQTVMFNASEHNASELDSINFHREIS